MNRVLLGLLAADLLVLFGLLAGPTAGVAVWLSLDLEDDDA